MDNRISIPKSSIYKVTPSAWKMQATIFLIGLLMVGIVGYGFYAGDRINTVDASLIRAAMKVKMEVSTTNLVIEGLLGDGFAADFEPIWKPLDSAFRNFQSIFDESKKRKTILPFQENTVHSDDIENLSLKLSSFKDKARQRFANKRISFLDQEVDIKYRQAFKNLLEALDTLEENLSGLMSNNLRFFRYSQAAMIVLCILLTFISAILFQRFVRQRQKAYVSLQRANQQLKNEIAQRRRYEKELSASEERFRQLAENIMDVFWLEDAGENHKIVYVSPVFEQWSGRKPTEVYEDGGILWQIVHPDDRERVINTYRDFTKDKGKFDTEFRIARPDGSIRWVLSRGYPIRDAKGRIQRIAGLSQDITGQKREEERREQLIKELKDFSNAVSHDLRAPLINLKGFTREIDRALKVIGPVVDSALASTGADSQNNVATAFYKDLPEAVEFINASVSKMERLTAAILKLSRLGRRELLLEQLDMNDIVQDTIKSLGHQVRERGIRLLIGDLPDTTADRVSMEQIFSNLVSNAVNYIPEGHRGEIEIGGESRMDENFFYIRDNGQGINNSDTEKVFNMFERLDANPVAGEGMGLAYVKALVRRHGGEVFCESEYGIGSKFSFTISKRIL